ncbi:MAG: alpha/beta hydrolase [Candidatus Eremiobacteraeota bacterium]|nr:alpha/beta hydrolase [Candidatus Eremiobacteraeota bacterium]
MGWMIALIAAALLAAPLPTETPQPDNSGRLADRQFDVTTPQGSGIARYFANGSLDGDAQIKRAVIVVHGVLRDADYYFDTGMRSAGLALAAGDTLVIAPQFVEASDLAGHNIPMKTLRWDSKWPGGSPATAPAPISTYAVFDAMIARLADRSRFPLLRGIVLVGHSAGGQIVQRYAVVGKAPQLDPGSATPVHLIVANPSSYFYFDDTRPVPQANCSDFNQWRYGLAGAPPYVAGTDRVLEERYVKRHVTYLLGTADINPNEDDLDRSCGGEAQGPYRFARGKFYIAYIERRHPSGTAQDYAFVAGVPHDNRRMFDSACGIGVIFGKTKQSCGAHGKV